MRVVDIVYRVYRYPLPVQHFNVLCQATEGGNYYALRTWIIKMSEEHKRGSARAVVDSKSNYNRSLHSTFSIRSSFFHSSIQHALRSVSSNKLFGAGGASAITVFKSLSWPVTRSQIVFRIHSTHFLGWYKPVYRYWISPLPEKVHNKIEQIFCVLKNEPQTTSGFCVPLLFRFLWNESWKLMVLWEPPLRNFGDTMMPRFRTSVVLFCVAILKFCTPSPLRFSKKQNMGLTKILVIKMSEVMMLWVEIMGCSHSW